MGAVYAALDTRLNRRLALKVMLPESAANPSSRERFLREARAAATITHDNVVTVYEADVRDGVPYIAMQYLRGYSLDEYLKKKGNPSVPQTLRVAREAAAGLAAAHRAGLIHRDIKPANLWLEAPHGRVKVLDFGLAKPLDTQVELTRHGAVVGTPAFMSPEQARGETVDHRTDLFSLGVVLYRLCTGRLPYRGPTTIAVLTALAVEEPPAVRGLNPAVPGPFAELIHQLLAKKAGDRPPTAEEVLRRLRAIADAPDASPAPPGAPPAAAQVVYVPIQVTALPEASPFSELDVTEPDTPPSSAPAGNKRLWLWLAVAAVLVAVAVEAFRLVKHKDRVEQKAEETTKPKDSRSGTGVKQSSPADGDQDRKAAEYVLSLGGFARVNGEDRDIRTSADLPRERFTLTYVDFADNQRVTDSGLARLAGCNNLTLLSLRSTRVTSAGLAHFAGCKGLLFLDLRITGVTDAGLAHFKDCKSLWMLGLSLTAVTNEGLVNFKDCTGLKTLYLNETKMTDAGLAYFKDCKSLADVDISATAVTNEGVAWLADCPGLAGLWLNNTAVGDDTLMRLTSCKRLTNLGVAKTAVTAKGLADFHAAVPGCKIHHDGGITGPNK
jgi:serine/threonine protein kinase